MPADYQERSDRYLVMTTDELLRLAADPKSLTTAARQALARELRNRGVDNPTAVAQYENQRDQEIAREGVRVAEIRWSQRSQFQKVFDHLKSHLPTALMASVGFPALGFLIGYGMVTLKVGNGRILSALVFVSLALGGVCSVAVARSPANIPLRVLGFLVAAGEFFYAFVFLFSATIGFR